MSKRTVSLETLPLAVRTDLQRLGAHIRTRRILRRERQRDLAARARISARTLAAAEKGDPAVSAGIYASLAWAVGLPALSTAAEQAQATAESSGLLPARVRAREQKP
jgi:transcriptional regulator with XRE-family HTH domain